MKVSSNLFVKTLIPVLLCFAQFQTVKAEVSLKSDSVYICTGNSSECYHFFHNCSGLNKCRACVILLHKDSVPSNYRFCKKCRSRIIKSKRRLQAAKKAIKKRSSQKSSPRIKSLLDEPVPKS